MLYSQCKDKDRFNQALIVSRMDWYRNHPPSILLDDETYREIVESFLFAYGNAETAYTTGVSFIQSHTKPLQTTSVMDYTQFLVWERRNQIIPFSKTLLAMVIARFLKRYMNLTDEEMDALQEDLSAERPSRHLPYVMMKPAETHR